MDTLEAREQDANAKVGYLLSAKGLLERLKKSVKEADAEMKRDVITTLVSRVDIKPGAENSPEIEILYLFGHIGSKTSATLLAQSRGRRRGG